MAQQTFMNGIIVEDAVQEWLGQRKGAIRMDKQQTKGEWVATGRMFIELNDEQIVYEVICDHCKGLAYFRRVTSVLFGAEYCPNCGTKMVEPQEVRNKG